MKLTTEILTSLIAAENAPSATVHIAQDIARRCMLTFAEEQEFIAFANNIGYAIETLAMFGLFTSPVSGMWAIDRELYALFCHCSECEIVAERDHARQQIEHLIDQLRGKQ